MVDASDFAGEIARVLPRIDGNGMSPVGGGMLLVVSPGAGMTVVGIGCWVFFSGALCSMKLLHIASKVDSGNSAFREI